MPINPTLDGGTYNISTEKSSFESINVIYTVLAFTEFWFDWPFFSLVLLGT